MNALLGSAVPGSTKGTESVAFYIFWEVMRFGKKNPH